MTRTTPSAPDPLADLRDPPETPAILDVPSLSVMQDAPSALGLVTQEVQEAARNVLIATWHADSTTLGLLHKGETCGCWYLSGVSVRAILPVQATDPA